MTQKTMTGVKVKISLPEYILGKADGCRKNHRCVVDTGNELCKVLCYMKDNICFVRCLDPADCSYLEPHSKTNLCTCPVRIEIYRRYKI